MKTYFRLNSDGSVNVEHKLFNAPIKKEKFAELSVGLEFENFLKLIKDLETKNKIIEERERILELQNLSKVGTKVVDGEIKGFYVGCLFFKDYFNSIKIKDFAIRYGYKCYGESFMNNLMNTGIFSGVEQEIRYYFKNQEISEEEYSKLSLEKSELTNIRDLSNPLDKSQSFVKVNKSR